MNRRLGVVSSSLEHPRTGKSISVSASASASALRACVRACEAAWASVSIMICMVRGGSSDFPGSPGSGPPPPFPSRLFLFGFVWACRGLAWACQK